MLYVCPDSDPGRREPGVPGRGGLPPPLLLQEVRQLLPQSRHRDHRLRLQVPQLPGLWPRGRALQLGQWDCLYQQQGKGLNKKTKVDNKGRRWLSTTVLIVTQMDASDAPKWTILLVVFRMLHSADTEEEENLKMLTWSKFSLFSLQQTCQTSLQSKL